jgi:hypothetical protein
MPRDYGQPPTGKFLLLSTGLGLTVHVEPSLTGPHHGDAAGAYSDEAYDMRYIGYS